MAFATSGFCAETSSSPVQNLSPGQCVWHAGDAPAWSAAILDESDWHPYSAWKLNPEESRIWVRCHVDSAALWQHDNSAVQVRMAAAYELFLNGVSIARNGNLQSGNFSMNRIRIFAVPNPLIQRGSNLLALRISRRYAALMHTPAFLDPPEIRVGNEQMLRNDRVAYIASWLPSYLLTDIPFVVIGIIGVVLLGSSLYDLTHIAPLVLSVSCIAVGVIFTMLIFGIAMLDQPVWFYVGVTAIVSAISIAAQYWFPFALAERRVPLVFKLLMGGVLVLGVGHLFGPLLRLPVALRVETFDAAVIAPAMNAAGALIGFASITAFWGWEQIAPSIRPIAGLTLAWGMGQSLLFAIILTRLGVIPGVPNLERIWTFPASSVGQFLVIGAIIVLNLREQRKVALHRASLAGEMQAAQEIQRALEPESIDRLPGLEIAIAFRPVREVGGDFYSCRILPGNRQRILLGDVSGKGAAAAMTAAVLLGAAQKREDESPSALLRHLNDVLKGMRLGGFTTCLCVDLTSAGSLVLSNAGHLAPYRNGEELKFDCGFPLGITADPVYTEVTLQLAPRDTLTFLSDGVVEARNRSGELFGFGRAAAMATGAAEEIASAAQRFGQDDDITVLTLIFVPAEVLQA